MYELHEACSKGHLPTIRKLLAQGHDVKETGPKGTTPMTLAISGDHFEAVSCLIEHTLKSLPDKDTITKHRAGQYAVVAKLFLQLEKTNSAKRAFSIALDNFEEIENKTDIEIRLYQECIQQRIKLRDSSNYEDIIDGMFSAIQVYSQIQEKNELDHLLFCICWLNLGETFKAGEELEKSKAAFLQALSTFDFYTAHPIQLFEKLGRAFIGVGECSASRSTESLFYLFAANCLTADAEELIDFEKILFQFFNKKTTPELCNHALLLIDMLTYFTAHGTLENNSLGQYFAEEGTKKRIQRIRTWLELKAMPHESYYDKDFLSFYAQGINDKDDKFIQEVDTMDDNLPPLDLSENHWSAKLI